MYRNKELDPGAEPHNDDLCEACGDRFGEHYGMECPVPRAESAIASTMRVFNTGATRDAAGDKPEYAGFLSPRVLHAYGKYMHRHRYQADGSLRASDNWQKGIPMDVYEQSMWRHFFDVWSLHRGLPAYASTPDMEEALCALLFNVMGYLHEFIKERDDDKGS